MELQRIINYFRDIKIVHLGMVDWLKRHGIKLLILALVLGAIWVALKNYLAPQIKTITVGRTKVRVEVVKTEAQRTQGLSGRDSLCQNCGMLFVYSQAGFHGIWMKEMKFDLDLVWINNQKVIGVSLRVPYPGPGQTDLPVYRPPQPADAVLEVPAGWVARNGIKMGDIVKY